MLITGIDDGVKKVEIFCGQGLCGRRRFTHVFKLYEYDVLHLRVEWSINCKKREVLMEDGMITGM